MDPEDLGDRRDTGRVQHEHHVVPGRAHVDVGCAGAVTESDAVAAVNFKKMMRWLSLNEWVTDDRRNPVHLSDLVGVRGRHGEGLPVCDIVRGGGD